MMSEQEEPLLVYDRLTHQRVLVTREQLTKEFQQYHDWYVWENIGNNKKVSAWLEEQEKNENV